MKKTFVVLTAILFSQFASAAADVKVLLSLEISPTRHALSFPTTLVEVEDDGEVTGYTCPFGARAGFCPERAKIEELGDYTLARIERLIKRAEAGQSVSPRGEFKCLAIPTTKKRYTANDGELLLEELTTPCGSYVFNDTRASLDLVKMLNTFHNEYVKLTEK